jgi:hypothetical protein
MGNIFRKIVLPALLAGLCSSGCHAGEPTVSSQEIEVTLTPAAGKLTGRTTLTVSGTGNLRLLLAPAAEVTEVIVDGRSASFRRSGSGVAVRVTETGKGEVTLVYSSRFADPLPSSPGAAEDPTYGVTAAITPAGTYLGAGSGWYPEPEVPPARRRVTVHAPAGISAVTAGRLARRTETDGETVTVWEVDQPVGRLSLSAGKFDVKGRRYGTVDIGTWFLSDDKNLAEKYTSASAGFIDFYSKLLGPYPFPKFAVVENFIPTGYGFPSYTLIGGSVLRLPFIVSTSLPHEIVHNWWGNGVFADYRHGNWSEGITTYLADHLQEERKSPQAGRSYRMKILADYATLVPPDKDFPLSRFTSRTDPASRSIGYGKGAMAFHMVRRSMGDEAFYAALRRMVREKLFRNASWEDFAAAFGGEAGDFLREFTEMKGGVSISVKEVALRRKGERFEVTGRIVQEAVQAAMPITLSLRKGETEVARATFRVGRGGKDFLLEAQVAPDRLVLDPDVDIFRTLADSEIPFTVNRIKASGSLTAVRGRLCRADETTLRQLLDSLGQRRAEIVREEESTSAALAGKDLLVCGVTREDLLPQLPDGITAGPDSFTVDGSRFSDPGDALLAVATRRGGGTIGLFLPLSQNAAEDVAPRITHYGGYGDLVFSGGKNVVKGLSLPAEGPGIIPLREAGR